MKPPSPAAAERIAAAPAARPARDSHSSCASGATAAPMLTDPPGSPSAPPLLRLGGRAGRDGPRANRVVLVVVGRYELRQPLTRGQHQVQAGGHEPDQRLEAIAGAALLWSERHRHPPLWWKKNSGRAALATSAVIWCASWRSPVRTARSSS